MVGIIIDAIVLMVLIKAINEDDISFGTAVVVALVAAIGTTVLAIALGIAMGGIGVLLAALIGAVLLGVAVSAMFGMEVKRAMLIAGIFMLVHIGFHVAIEYMRTHAA